MGTAGATTTTTAEATTTTIAGATTTTCSKPKEVANGNFRETNLGLQLTCEEGYMVDPSRGSRVDCLTGDSSACVTAKSCTGLPEASDGTNCSDQMSEGSYCVATCNADLDLQRVGGFTCSGGSLKGISYCIATSVKVKETDVVQASLEFTVNPGDANNVANTIKAALAEALGIDVKQIVNVQVRFVEGRSLAESTTKVLVDFLVAVPEGESVGNVMTKMTELTKGDSSTKFVTAMEKGGVAAAKPTLVAAPVAFTQTMVEGLNENPVKEVDVYREAETDAAMRSPALIAHVFVLQFLAWVMRRIL